LLKNLYVGKKSNVGVYYHIQNKIMKISKQDTLKEFDVWSELKKKIEFEITNIKDEPEQKI